QWLEAEVATVKPHVIVCLGSTAAKAVISKDFKVSIQRGQFVESALAPYVFATLHPSALLRLQEDEEREVAFKQLVKDLSLIKKACRGCVAPRTRVGFSEIERGATGSAGAARGCFTWQCGCGRCQPSIWPAA